MDRRDEIIRLQMDVINQMTRNNLNRIADDLWGVPSAPQVPSPSAETTDVPASPAGKAEEEKKTQQTPAATEQVEEEPPENIEDLKKELNEYIGLDTVKKEVESLINLVTVQKMRKENGLPVNDLSLHMVFSGNPGTGKTTVARIMGNIFYSLGLLPSNKVIELSAKDLVAPYMGQTAPKTHDAMMRGMGGVVFVDEAYSLTESGSQSGGGFGVEAVAEMLQIMENYKNKFICIAAGYPREMRQWLDTNSGLASRFTTTISFDDYSADELATIAANIIAKRNLTMSDDARTEMLKHFTRLTANKGRNFANAREARNYVDKVLLNQGRRLRTEMKLPGFTNERLYVLEAADMKIDD